MPRPAPPLACCLLAPLLLQGCLLGADPLKGEPNIPGVVSAEVVQPAEPHTDGRYYVNDGTEVVVALSTRAVLDTERSTVTLDGYPMTFLEAPDRNTYLYTRTLDGTEGNAPRALTGTLVNPSGGEAQLQYALPLTTDFLPPTGACLLAPRVANAGSDVTLTVSVSEPLRGGQPEVVASDPDLAVTFREVREGQYLYDVVATPGVNLDGYVLEVTAVDLAGNPQSGPSLCDLADRTGTILGRGPQLVEEPIVTATESNLFEGTLWVRSGGQVTVTLPTVDPIDPAQSTVRLSGVDLAYDQDNTWTASLGPEDGDGFKTLDALLVDAAGNSLRVQRPDVLRLDTTPPSADCVLSPKVANASQPVTFDVYASEPLLDAPDPTADHPLVEVSGPAVNGNHRRYSVGTTEPANVAYQLAVTGTDRAGNPPIDDVFCAPENREGQILSLVPELQGEPAFEITPSVLVDGVPWARAGAVVSVTVDTAYPIDPGLTSLTLSGVPLIHDADQRWTLELSGEEGDGFKTLDLHLVDAAGNATHVQRPQVARLDFSPPVADCVLSPTPANAAQAEQGIALTVFASEPLGGAGPTVVPTGPVELVDQWSADTVYGFVLAPTVSDSDFHYSLAVSGTDRVGNLPAGDLCAPVTLEGEVVGRLPRLAADPSLTVTPHVVHEGETWARAGAELRVVLPTERAIDPAVSNVTLSGIPLTFEGDDTWTAVLDGTEGDGSKWLQATLVDPVGNVAPLARPDIGFVADFTPPDVISSVLQRIPFFAPADDGLGTVKLNRHDPFTGEDVRASLRVTTDETLGQMPALLVDGPGPAAFVEAGYAGRAADWSLPQVPDAEGAYGLSVVLTDVVGNESPPVPLTAMMQVDHTGPTSAPAVDAPHAVVYHRQPWGSLESGPTPWFEVAGAAGSVQPDATVVLIGPLGNVLSHAPADAEGAFAGLRAPADLPQLGVAQLDDAGNHSPVGQVRDVAWTANLNGKALGDVAVNPHRFWTTDRAPNSLWPPQGTWEERASTSAHTVGGGPRWELAMAGTSETPTVRWDHGIAHDAARATTVVFGGEPWDGAPDPATWLRGQGSWRAQTPAVSPPPQTRPAMAYDSARGVVVLYGEGQTWEWDGQVWTQRHPATSPTAGSGVAMAYDSRRGVTVLFGGEGGLGYQDETWEWDGADWVLREPANRPPSTGSQSLAFDQARGVTVLYIGVTGPGGGGPKTWLWDGEDWEAAPAGTDEPPGAAVSIAYVPEHERVYLFGLAGALEMWAWDGSSWSEVEPPVELERYWATGALVWDSARSALVLFGESWEGPCYSSASGTDCPNFTWEWDGERWHGSTLSPHRRDRGALAFHRFPEGSAVAELVPDGGVVFTGGYTLDMENTDPCGHLWVWTGRAWMQVADHEAVGDPTQCTPRAWELRCVSEEMGGELWCTTGDGDVHVHDGQGWSVVAGAAQTPVPAVDFQLVYDAQRDRMVQWGGLTATVPHQSLSDRVWEWSYNPWSRRTPGTPGGLSELRYPQAVFHRSRGTTLTFGGREGSGNIGGVYPDTLYEWDGASWAQVSTAPGPEGRIYHALAYDGLRDALVVHGGRTWPAGSLSATVHESTWEWADGGWTERDEPYGPGAIQHASMAFDDNLGLSVLHGGSRGGSANTDTWTWGLRPEWRPGHTFEVSFAAAGVHPEAEVTGITAWWEAGGHGTPDGDRIDGADLLVWDEGRWKVVAQNGASDSSPQPLCWSVRRGAAVPEVDGCTGGVDPLQVGRLLRFGPSRSLFLSARPSAPSGDAPGAVTSGQVEVTVRYRLPEGP